MVGLSAVENHRRLIMSHSDLAALCRCLGAVIASYIQPGFQAAHAVQASHDMLSWSLALRNFCSRCYESFQAVQITARGVWRRVVFPFLFRGQGFHVYTIIFVPLYR